MRFADGAAFVDGEMVPIAEANISLLDWGFLHSDATYDVAHVWRGAFFRLDDHIERFFAGMDGLRMSIPYDGDRVQEILCECAGLSGLRDAYVEMICTRGFPAPGSRDPRTCQNRFFAFAIPFIWIADPAKQELGLHLIISQKRRIAPEAVDPTVKNYHWLDLVMGLYEAYERGGETAVVVDEQGDLVEGPGFNVFAVRDGTIITPARGMLEGITRRTVLELAKAQGRGIEVRALTAKEVQGCDEVFITSTAGGIMPVTAVDGHAVGHGVAGPVTMALHEAYWRVHQDPSYALPVLYAED